MAHERRPAQAPRETLSWQAFNGVRELCLRPDDIKPDQEVSALLVQKGATPDSFAAHYRLEVEFLGGQSPLVQDRIIGLAYLDEVGSDAPDLKNLRISAVGPLIREKKISALTSGHVRHSREEAGLLFPSNEFPAPLAGLEPIAKKGRWLGARALDRLLRKNR